MENKDIKVIENYLYTLYQGKIAGTVIPTSKVNAWKGKYFRNFINNRLGIQVSSEQFRDIVNGIRKDGLAPILGDNVVGYWFSRDPYEIKSYIKNEKDGYITTTRNTIHCYERHLTEFKINPSKLKLPILEDLKMEDKRIGEFIDAYMGGKTKYRVPTAEKPITTNKLQENINTELGLNLKPKRKGNYFSNNRWNKITQYVKLVGDYPFLSSTNGIFTGNEEDVNECIQYYSGRLKSHIKAMLGLKVFEPKERPAKLF